MTIDALCKLDTLDNFVDGMTKYKEILATFAENENDAKVFMGVFEEFVCRRNKEQFEDKVYKLLLALYDNDIVDEEDLLKWDALPNDKAVIVDQDEAQEIREKAAPFIKWLKESDSDSDGEEESVESIPQGSVVLPQARDTVILHPTGIIPPPAICGCCGRWRSKPAA